MEAEIFYDSYLPDALFMALEYAGEEGFVASLPQLLKARTKADYDNIIWKTWYTSNSEENQLITPQGNEVIVTVHGGGIFASPERFRKLFHSNVNRDCKTGFTGLFSGKITEQEASDVLLGKMPDGAEIPIYDYAEFKKGVVNLPRRYGVVMDYDLAKRSVSGYEAFDELKDDPLMIVRAGGVEAAETYLDKAKAFNNVGVMGSLHLYNETEYRKPHEIQSSLIMLSGNRGGKSSEEDYRYIRGLEAEYGIQSGNSMINTARFVAVVPRNLEASVRDLTFGIERGPSGLN